ncbi:hypothetical protein ANN_01039 [Periplaneta americana]|uniref:Uncharacterized protein n=1 Tax=Periplaneta americana TaxID=6978 RepID=A0ABQ8TSI8_PERAM|nr:hypothetical protein ANN_01039 [Periplaneta americana]
MTFKLRQGDVYPIRLYETDYMTADCTPDVHGEAQLLHLGTMDNLTPGQEIITNGLYKIGTKFYSRTNAEYALYQIIIHNVCGENQNHDKEKQDHYTNHDRDYKDHNKDHYNSHDMDHNKNHYKDDDRNHDMDHDNNKHRDKDKGPQRTRCTNCKRYELQYCALSVHLIRSLSRERPSYECGTRPRPRVESTIFQIIRIAAPVCNRRPEFECSGPQLEGSEFECSGPQLEGPEFECSGPQLEGPEFEYSGLSLKYDIINIGSFFYRKRNHIYETHYTLQCLLHCLKTSNATAAIGEKPKSLLLIEWKRSLYGINSIRSEYGKYCRKR